MGSQTPFFTHACYKPYWILITIKIIHQFRQLLIQLLIIFGQHLPLISLQDCARKAPPVIPILRASETISRLNYRMGYKIFRALVCSSCSGSVIGRTKVSTWRAKCQISLKTFPWGWFFSILFTQARRQVISCRVRKSSVREAQLQVLMQTRIFLAKALEIRPCRLQKFLQHKLNLLIQSRCKRQDIFPRSSTNCSCLTLASFVLKNSTKRWISIGLNQRPKRLEQEGIVPTFFWTRGHGVKSHHQARIHTLQLSTICSAVLSYEQWKAQAALASGSASHQINSIVKMSLVKPLWLARNTYPLPSSEWYHTLKFLKKLGAFIAKLF